MAETAGVGVAFFFAALLGLRVGLPGTSASPVWLAAGVSLAGALLFGRHVLIGVFIAAVLAEHTVNPLPLSVAMAVANVAEPLIAATALQHFAHGRCDLLHTRDTAVLLLFGAGVGAIVSATLGVSAIVVTFALDGSVYAVNWFTWWLGDVSGLILVTPMLVYLVRQPYRKPSPGRLAQGVLLVAATGVVAQLAFSGSIDRVWALPALFLIMLLIIWTAFRFGPRISMLSVDLAAAVAVVGAVRMRGPFMGPSLNTTLLSLQAAMCALGIAALILATLVNQRREALLAVEASRDELEQKVRERTAELEELATHDPLTGLLNRRAFADVLTRAVGQARRGHSSALLYGDLDEFKDCNDALGHAGGDAVLVAVAEALSTEARSADAVARLGGDEFAVLLDGATLPGALAVGKRMCARVEELGASLGVGMGMSAGLAAVDGTRDMDDVLVAADRAMYAAKARRDGVKVVLAEAVATGDTAGAGAAP